MTTQRFIIITAKDCQGCRSFKTYHYDNLIKQLEEYKIKYKHIEIESRKNIDNATKMVAEYHQKLPLYFKFYPMFMLVDESSFKAKQLKIDIYNVDIKYIKDQPRIELKSGNIPTADQLMEWILSKLKIKPKKTVIVKGGNVLKWSSELTRGGVKHNLDYSFDHLSDEENYEIIAI